MIKDCEDIVKEICQNIKSEVFWVESNETIGECSKRAHKKEPFAILAMTEGLVSALETPLLVQSPTN